MNTFIALTLAGSTMVSAQYEQYDPAYHYEVDNRVGYGVYDRQDGLEVQRATLIALAALAVGGAIALAIGFADAGTRRNRLQTNIDATNRRIDATNTRVTNSMTTVTKVCNSINAASQISLMPVMTSTAAVTNVVQAKTALEEVEQVLMMLVADAANNRCT